MQTLDLRFRKLSGRHQISTDGKHLVDGVAFGRPFMMRIDRPPIRIPPRKRRRTTYDDHGAITLHEHANDQQDLVHAGLDRLNEISPDEDSESDNNYTPDTSKDILPDEDSGFDDDYSLDEDETNDLSLELKNIHDDSRRYARQDWVACTDDSEMPSNLLEAGKSPRRSKRSRKVGGLGLGGANMLKLVDENGRPYPGEYNNPLLDLYLHEGTVAHPRSATYIAQSKRRGKSNSQRSIGRADHKYDMRTEHGRGGMPNSNWKAVRFQDAQLETPATVRDSHSHHLEYEDAQPSSNVTPSQHESDKENSDPRYAVPESSAVSTETQIRI